MQKKRGGLRLLISYLLMFGVVIALVSALLGNMNEEKIQYSDIEQLFKNIGTDEEAVKTFTLDSSNKLVITTTKDNKIKWIVQDREIWKEGCYTYVVAYNALADEKADDDIKPMEYDLVEPTSYPVWLTIIPYIILLGGFIFLMIFVMKQTGSGGKGNTFAKSRAKIVAMDDKKRVLFSDVAGADEEKEELKEVVEFLKDPTRFSRLGAKIPHGVLLMGPPGTGKTLLAKAVAGEAGVPFFSISGSDFVELYVGVGASRVRDLFETARKHPASIVFIDEIDAVGRHRGAGLGGGHDEREQTLNQLLVEMDGFTDNSGIIIIAATNRPDILDPALLRPGRFDRQITVDYPDLRGRVEILKVHSKNKPFEKAVDFETVAKSTVGFTGADLANLLNEAALLAARRGKSLIGMNDIEDATMKIIVGTQKKSWKIKESEKRKTAIHEAGHALLAYLLPTQDPVHQISIVPSGRALGYTVTLPTDDKHSVYKKELKEKITMLLGGRVAESVFFDDISGGASNDIQRATEIARKMVLQFGMSDKLGPIQFGSSNEEVFLGRSFGETRNYSEKTASAIDEEIHSIIKEAQELAEKLIRANQDKMNFMADFLVKNETMDEAQFKALMEGNPTMEELENMINELRKKSMQENEEQRKRIIKEREQQEAKAANTDAPKTEKLDDEVFPFMEFGPEGKSSSDDRSDKDDNSDKKSDDDDSDGYFK